MTIAPDRLEELDFPTPDDGLAPPPPLVRVGWERDGVVHIDEIPEPDWRARWGGSPPVIAGGGGGAMLTPEAVAAVQERTRQELMALWAAPMTRQEVQIPRVYGLGPRVEMTRLGPLAVDYGLLAGGAYMDRGLGTCWCSPSRAMLMAETRWREVQAEAAAAARRRQRRQMRKLAAFFAVWTLTALLIVLV